MPLISSFYGVLVYLYWLDTRQHHLPHIYAMYARDEGLFGIENGASRVSPYFPSTL